MDIYIHVDTLRCSPEPGHVNLIKSSMESFHSEVSWDMTPLAFRLRVTAIHTCKSAQCHERLGYLNSEGGRIAYLPDLNTVDSADIISKSYMSMAIETLQRRNVACDISIKHAEPARNKRDLCDRQGSACCCGGKKPIKKKLKIISSNWTLRVADL